MRLWFGIQMFTMDKCVQSAPMFFIIADEYFCGFNSVKFRIVIENSEEVYIPICEI